LQAFDSRKKVSLITDRARRHNVLTEQLLLLLLDPPY
jgi:hypothetical protein